VILVLSATFVFLCGYLIYSRTTGNEFLFKKSDVVNVSKETDVVDPIGEPFDRGLVTITFDDGHESQFKEALPLLKKNNFSATFYISTGLLNTPGYMNDDQIKQLVADNHHIGAHTVSHPHLPVLSEVDLDRELGESQKYLQNKFGVEAKDFASPYGDVNEQVMRKVIEKYRSHRNVLAGYNYQDTFDIYGVKVQNILVTTTAEEVKAWIKNAQENKSWLVLVYHQIDDKGDTYSATPKSFEGQIDAIAKSKIDVVSFDKALVELLPQIGK